jgi:hypothetical protein
MACGSGRQYLAIPSDGLAGADPEILASLRPVPRTTLRRQLEYEIRDEPVSQHRDWGWQSGLSPIMSWLTTAGALANICQI